MIISKAGTFKMLRILCIFCAIGMGFMTLVGTSEDDATDAAGIDDSFNETATFEMEPVTVEKVGATSIMAAGDDCDTLSINDALDEVKDDIKDFDKLDISSVKLEYVSGDYEASWTPGTVTSFSCSLTINGNESTTIAETAINGSTGTIDDTLTQEQIDVINYYLANRDELFEYCVVCDDVELDSYSVTYNVEIGVRIKGDIDVL
jgi:hypothetical protein